MFLRQILDVLLFRKTCGTGCGSDKTGGILVNDLGPGRFDTLANRFPGNIIPLSKNHNFFPF